MWNRLIQIACGIFLVLGGESAFFYFVTRNDMIDTEVFITAIMSIVMAVWGVTLLLTKSKEDTKT